MGKNNNIYRLLPILFIILLIFILFGRTLFPEKFEIIYGGDLLTQFYFWKGYLVDNLKQGQIPFWNPYNFSGTPFLAHPGVAPFYPATIIFLLFPLYLAFSLNYALHLFIGGVGMYLLARKYGDWMSSLTASSIFILSGYFAARIYAGHVDLLNTSVWIPWVFLSFKNILERPTKSNVLSGVLFFSLEILAGYSAYVVFTIEFIFLYCLYYFYTQKLHKNFQGIKRIVFSLSLVVVFSIAITAIQWFPTWQFTKNSIRGEGLPYEIASWGSLPLSSLKLFIDPVNREELNKISFNLGGGPKPNPFDHFVGRLPVLIVFSFILFKIFTNIKIHRDFWIFALISLFFIWISFANFITPNLHFIFYKIIPFYRYIRIPLQHLVIAVVLMPLMIGMIFSQVKNISVKILFLMLFLMELFLFDKQYIFLTQLSDRGYDHELISFLQNNLKNTRLLPDYRVISPVLRTLDLNASMKYKIETTSGYDPMILKNYYSFIDFMAGSVDSSIPLYNVEIPPVRLNQELIKYLNAEYILTEKESNDLNKVDSSLNLIKESDLYRLYQYKNSLPRFWLTGEVKTFRDKNELDEAILDKNYDLAKTVLLLEKDLPKLSSLGLLCSQSNRGEVREAQYKVNKIILEINLLCNSFLSSSEVYYPSWKAKINGKYTNIYQGNLAFRSMYLPKGSYKVELLYDPNEYYQGVVLFFIGILGVVVYVKKYAY